MEYLNSSNTKVKEEIYSWMFEGDYTDASPLILATVVPRLPYTNGTPDSLYIHFTHKQLDTLVTNTFYDSEVVTKTDLFSYFDGTLVRTHTERADDSAERTTGYVYAFRTTNAAPYSGMRTKNLRSQLARVSLFREPNPNTKYGFWSTATTWKEIDGIYLPDQEYKWRHEFFEGQFPAFSWHPDSVGEGDQDWILTTSFTSYDTHGNLTTVKDAYNVSTTIDWDATGTLIDSITTRPNATTNLVTHYDYDDNTFRLISITDPNEKMVNFKYDALQRLIEIIAPDKSTTGRLSYYYSRAFNSDTLSITNPNYVESTLTSGNAFFDAFEYTDAPENHGWAEYLGASNGVMSTVYDASLQSRVLRTEVTSGANDSYAIKYPASGHLGAFQSRVSVKVKNSQSSSSFRVVVWYANNEYTIVYKFNDGTNSYDSGSRTLNIFAGAAFKDGSWRILERDLLADFRLTGIQADFEYIRRIIVRGEYDLDDVLTDVPATTVTYADGLGRSIQTAQYDYEGAVKAATVYDFADRVTRAYKPFTSSDRSFTPAFHDSTNAYYTTKFFPYYPNPSTDTSPYSYSETTYLNDPLNRIDKQGFPGNAFRIGSGREIKFAYLTNAGDEVNHFGASLHKVRRRNENGVYLNTFQDSFGRFVVQRVDTANFNYKTEFAYDLADRLFQTHHPNGTSTAAVYDTWSQLLSLNSPDAGTIYYLYDKKGRLRFVKDGKGAEEGYFIYYKYDDLNRKIEEGTVSGLTAFQQDNADIRDFPTSTTHTVKVKYHYDAAAYYPSTTQRNLKGRLEAIEYLTERYSLPGYMFYSYDDNGNIEWLEQHIPKSNTADGNAYLSVKISYEYDAAGKIMKTHYRRIFPPGAGSDAFFIWYEYDALARLARVFTNTSDARPNAANAEYLYWPNGQLRRVILGDTLQGVDYLYNSRDWLTQINHQNLNSSQDPGGDGGAGVPNVDRFGQIIGYNVQGHIAGDADFSADFAAKYNGNITWTIHNTFGNETPGSLTGWVFKYNSADRLSKANWGYFTDADGWTEPTSRYDLINITYDASGNLTHMKRRMQNAVGVDMYYYYKSGSNQLDYVDGLNSQVSGNYSYDANGNMIKDVAKLGSTSTITYDYRNLPVQVPKSVTPAGTLYFGYDGKGQRVFKNDLIYVPDLNGRVLAVYDLDGTHLYWNIWGLDLIGQKFFAQ